MYYIPRCVPKRVSHASSFQSFIPAIPVRVPYSMYIYIYMYLLSYIITSHILSHFCYPLLCPQKSSTTYLIPCSSYALYTYIHTHIHSPRFHPASYISQLHQPVTSASYISQLRYSNHPFFFDVPQISKAYIIYLIYIYTYHDIS